jgi:hypothetical protein
VANKRNYLARLQMVIQQLHNCGAIHSTTIPVHEVFQGQTVWKGEVEIFNLIRHPEAKRCYGWLNSEGKDNKGEQFVTVLEIPPVVSAMTAVRASIVKDVRDNK